MFTYPKTIIQIEKPAIIQSSRINRFLLIPSWLYAFGKISLKLARLARASLANICHLQNSVRHLSFHNWWTNATKRNQLSPDNDCPENFQRNYNSVQKCFQNDYLLNLRENQFCLYTEICIFTYAYYLSANFDTIICFVKLDFTSYCLSLRELAPHTLCLPLRESGVK